MEQVPGYPCPQVPRGRVVSPAFGRWLEARRGPHRDRAFIVRQVRKLLEPTGILFSKSDLSRKVNGELPNALHLYAFGKVLSASTDEMVNIIAADLHLPGGVEPGETAPLLSDQAIAIARRLDDLSEEHRRIAIRLLNAMQEPGAAPESFRRRPSEIKSDRTKTRR